MLKKLFLAILMTAVAASVATAKPSKKKVEAEAEEQVYEVRKRDSNYVVMDIEGVKRIEIQCTIPKKEAQMKFDILSDVGEYDNFKDESHDGNYDHLTGCDYLGKSYHKILDKKLLEKYQKEGIDELYLVFANRNLMKNSKVKVSIKYVYNKDSDSSAAEAEDSEE
ncbi:MAG: hypothetical protein IJJ66_09065 [Treponema sp.]|nr:hypothetical protein [Treponema sp.]MBR0476953.1 hypothetical protein [Treponema sp.]